MRFNVESILLFAVMATGCVNQASSRTPSLNAAQINAAIPLAVLKVAQLIPTAEAVTTLPPTSIKWIQYHIPQSEQYPTENEADYITVKSMTRYALFNESDQYELSDSNTHEEINKLYGTSDCNDWTHTDSSARWGWRYNSNNSQIELFAYVEFQGNHLYQHNQVPDAVAAVGKPIKLAIVMNTTSPSSYPSQLFSSGSDSEAIVGAHRDPSTGDGVFETVLANPFPGSYDFYVNDVKVNTLPRACNHPLAEGPELLPFFAGGKIGAPHEIMIELSPEVNKSEVKN